MRRYVIVASFFAVIVVGCVVWMARSDSDGRRQSVVCHRVADVSHLCVINRCSMEDLRHALEQSLQCTVILEPIEEQRAEAFVPSHDRVLLGMLTEAGYLVNVAVVGESSSEGTLFGYLVATDGKRTCTFTDVRAQGRQWVVAACKHEAAVSP